MAYSRTHTSAYAADHVKLLLLNRRPVELTHCHGLKLSPT